MHEPGGRAVDVPLTTAERVDELERRLEELLRSAVPVPRPADPPPAGGATPDRRRQDRRRRDAGDRLTLREREVLALMAQGYSNAGIGLELHLSERSVEATTSAIFRKLGLTPRPTANRRVLAVLAYLGT